MAQISWCAPPEGLVGGWKVQLDYIVPCGSTMIKIGDLVRLHSSTRRNGRYAGNLGLVVNLDAFDNPVIKVKGEVRSVHRTQVEEVLCESR